MAAPITSMDVGPAGEPEDFMSDAERGEQILNKGQKRLQKESQNVAAEELGLRTFSVLLILVSVRMMVHWQRSIFSYAYGYTGVGD